MRGFATLSFHLLFHTDIATSNRCPRFSKIYYFVISVFISYLLLFKGFQSPSRGPAEEKDIIYIPQLTNGGEAGGLCACISILGICGGEG